MKKGLALLTCSFLALPVFANNNSLIGNYQRSFRQNAVESIEWPAPGTTDPTTPFGARWFGDRYGFKRIGDTAVAITGFGTYGARCDYGQTLFTRDEFEISLDLTEAPASDVITVTLGSEYSAYMETAACQLCLEILKSPISETPHDYLITLNRGFSKNEAHNTTTVDGWINHDQAPWLDSYEGAIVTAENDIITLGFNNITETTADFYVNDYKKTLPTAVVFETLEKEFYLSLGTGFNGDNKHFVVNHVYGKGDKEYYSENGIYQSVKSEINSFVKKASETEIKTIDDFVNIYTEGNAINFSDLKSYDVTYLKRTLDPAINTLKDTAISKFGNDAFLSLYNVSLDELEALQADFDKSEALNAAIVKCKELEQLKIAIDGLTLTEEQKTKFDGLVAKYNDVLTKVNTACGDFYKNSINTAITAMDEATTIEQANKAEIAYLSIDTLYAAYVEASLRKELEDKLNVSRATFVEKFTLNEEESAALGLAIPNGNTYVSKHENGIAYSSHGSTSTGAEAGSGLLFKKEAVDVADFSITYNVKEFNQYAISLMANPTFWSNADDPSIQNHKGIIFLVTSKNETTASVETYLIDGTSNRFFDGQVAQSSFDIPKTGEIKLSFKINTVEQSGIYDNYFEYDFNGHKYQSPVIKAFNLLGAFENGKGYLGIGAQGGDNSHRLAMDITDINGNNPATATTIAKTVDYAPQILDKTYTFELKSTNNLIVPVNPMLKTISKVAIDGVELTKEDYTWTRNSTLTLKAKSLNKLTAGEHKLTITTDGGTAETTLTITSKDVEPENPDPEKPNPENPEPETPQTDDTGLSGGAIAGIAVGSAAGVGLIGALIWFFLKKKNKK